MNDHLSLVPRGSAVPKAGPASFGLTNVADVASVVGKGASLRLASLALRGSALPKAGPASFGLTNVADVASVVGRLTAAVPGSLFAGGIASVELARVSVVAKLIDIDPVLLWRRILGADRNPDSISEWTGLNFDGPISQRQAVRIIVVFLLLALSAAVYLSPERPAISGLFDVLGYALTIKEISSLVAMCVPDGCSGPRSIAPKWRQRR